jgi:hypothetical protein
MHTTAPGQPFSGGFSSPRVNLAARLAVAWLARRGCGLPDRGQRQHQAVLAAMTTIRWRKNATRAIGIPGYPNR